jgi:hypothetical protein
MFGFFSGKTPNGKTPNGKTPSGKTPSGKPPIPSAALTGIRALLKPRGLNVVNIAGNGNCLFLSLSAGLTNTFTNVSSMSNNFLAVYLRKSAVERVRRNDELMQNMFADDLYGQPTAQQRLFDTLPVGQKVPIYSSIMSKFNGWGTNFELAALSEILPKCIQVYKLENGNKLGLRTMPHDCHRPGEPVKIHHNGSHYETILTDAELAEYSDLPRSISQEYEGISDNDLNEIFNRVLAQIQNDGNTLAQIIEFQESLNKKLMELNTRKSKLYAAANAAYTAAVNAAATTLGNTYSGSSAVASSSSSSSSSSSLPGQSVNLPPTACSQCTFIDHKPGSTACDMCGAKLSKNQIELLKVPTVKPSVPVSVPVKPAVSVPLSVPVKAAVKPAVNPSSVPISQWPKCKACFLRSPVGSKACTGCSRQLGGKRKTRRKLNKRRRKSLKRR